MDVFEGVQSWTPTELKQKEDAVAQGAQRSLVSVVKSAVPDEFEIVRTDGDTQEADWSYLLSAQNHLLAQLNFPNKLKPFLDTILSSACGNGELEFSATNLEIGQKSRSGRDACTDKSMEKWVSRQKQELEDWMAYKSFRLVSITPGEYDFGRNRRLPTRYQVFFNKYVVKAANLAKTKFYWNKGKDARALRNRALREAARQTLQEIPEAPNLALRPAKTLSEEQKFDRRHHSMLTFMEKNRDALRKMNLEPSVYFRFLVGEMDKIALNPSGMVGKILTPERDEADHKTSVWQKIKSGSIVEDIERNTAALDERLEWFDRDGSIDQVAYAAEVSRGEEKEIQTPQFFRDGEFVTAEQRFEGPPKVEESVESVKQLSEKSDQGDILSTKGTFLSGNSKNADKIETRAVSDDFKHQGDIFVSMVEENGESVKHIEDQEDKNVPMVEDDFTDWFADAADVNQASVLTPEFLQLRVEEWTAKVRELVPDKNAHELWLGAWQVYLDPTFATDAQMKKWRIVEDVMSHILEGGKYGANLEVLREAFALWVAAGASYYEKGACVPQSDHKLKLFRDRLIPHLRCDDG